MADVAAVILAAGRATRFGAGGGTKAAALWRGKPLVRWVAEAALASRVSETIVVTGHAAAAVEAALGSLDVRMVANPHFATGLASSLQAGVEASNAARAVVVLLADMPKIGARLIDELIGCYEKDGMRADAVVPTFEGEAGNPVLLGRTMFAAVAELRGDAGARRLLADPGLRVLSHSVADPAIGVDVDTPGALQALERGR